MSQLVRSPLRVRSSLDGCWMAPDPVLLTTQPSQIIGLLGLGNTQVPVIRSLGTLSVTDSTRSLFRPFVL